MTELIADGAVLVRCERMAIPKKNRSLGYRIVYKVESDLLKNTHKVLCKYLNEAYESPTCVFGFVPDGCTQRNAAQHLGKKKILSLDIDSFFDSITERMIEETFCRLGCRRDIAIRLTQLTTINGALPQGFNTSPVLANIVFQPLDEKLVSICGEYECTYSRYADDITISTDGQLPLSSEINKVLSAGGFRLNSSKERMMCRGEKQYVTGLTVFDQRYPRVPKRFKRKIRLQLYYLVKFGAESYSMRELDLSEEDIRNDYHKLQLLSGRVIRLSYRIKGWIDYVNSIEPLLAEKYYQSFNAIDWRLKKAHGGINARKGSETGQ